MLLFLLSLIYKGVSSSFLFFFIDTATTEIYTLSLHDALPIFGAEGDVLAVRRPGRRFDAVGGRGQALRLAVREVGDPHAGVLVPDPRAVHAPRVVADAARGRVVLLAHQETLLAGTGEQEELLPVG